MMEIFYFFPNNYLEQLNMVPKCRLRSTSTTQIDKNDKKELLKILKTVWNPFQKKTVLLLYLVNTNEIPDNFSLGPVSAKNTWHDIWHPISVLQLATCRFWLCVC